jgi:protein SCO1/2
MLIYFGFTNCPDICPAELKKMGKALDILAARGVGSDIVPIFVSVDPRRDTLARLNEYKQGFHPRMVWMTGSDQQLAPVAKAFRVYYSIPDGAQENYLVDHSIFFYLMDRQGAFVDFFGKSLEAEEIAVKIEQQLKADRTAPPQKATEAASIASSSISPAK